MAGYQGLSRISDGAVHQVCKAIYDALGALQRRVTAIEQTLGGTRTSSLDAGGQRIVNLAPPQAGSDAVSLTYLRAYVAAQLEGLNGGLTQTVDTATTPTLTVAQGRITGVS